MSVLVDDGAALASFARRQSLDVAQLARNIASRAQSVSGSMSPDNRARLLEDTIEMGILLARQARALNGVPDEVSVEVVVVING